ncbi:MAG: hypothetical protein ACRDTH_17570 [Pseudonocardiaceae bacterium]
MADTDGHDVFDARPGIRYLLDHDSFPHAGQMLRTHPELLSEAGDQALDALGTRSEPDDLGYPDAAIAQLRAFLDRCRRTGLDTVFPHGHPDIDPHILTSVRPDMAEAAEALYARTSDPAQLNTAAGAWRRILREPRLDSAYPGLAAALRTMPAGCSCAGTGSWATRTTFPKPATCSSVPRR